MTQESIKQAVLGQLQRTFEMLKDAIQGFNDNTWRQLFGIRPASTALHAVETVEFYFSGKSAEEFPWRHRFGVDWAKAADEELPGQSAILDYLSEVEVKLRDYFTKSDLSAAEQIYPYTGKTVLERCLYVLRHTQHHIGQLNAALLSAGRNAAGWK